MDKRTKKIIEEVRAEKGKAISGIFETITVNEGEITPDVRNRVRSGVFGGDGQPPRLTDDEIDLFLILADKVLTGEVRALRTGAQVREAFRGDGQPPALTDRQAEIFWRGAAIVAHYARPPRGPKSKFPEPKR